MKQEIWWHEECLQNRITSSERERKRLTRAIEDLEQIEKATKFLAEQIAEAKRRGMDSFDRDRLLKKRPIRVDGAMVACGETED